MGWIHTCRLSLCGVVETVMRLRMCKAVFGLALTAGIGFWLNDVVTAQPFRTQIPVTSPMPAVRAPFNFKIDPKTPLKDLLPIPPTARHLADPILEDDLTRVPEIAFQKPLAKKLPAGKALEATAHTMAKINHLNQKRTDAFMEALLGSRADLSGLPFEMGDSCRLKQERSRHFQQALNTVRQAMASQVDAETHRKPVDALKRVKQTMASQAMVVPAGAQFWQRYRGACFNEDEANAKFDPPYQEHVTLARIAALMQILAPESASMRKGLIRYLDTVSHPEATRALAKLAIFSKERSVREAACDVLKVRRERDYTEILLSGLHYPWPAVARYAADAIVRLERKDLIPQLVAVLERPDPRLPEVKKTGDKSVTAVRELVRVNHHRNCLLCHAPMHNVVQVTLRDVDGNPTTEVITREVENQGPGDVPTAQVPIPGEPLPTPSEGYGNSQPDILVRLDVTYLRQDFSELQSVADAHPWPEMQRFDFLVRTRSLTDEEAQVYREKLSTREPGRVTPYQRAALAALRDLTGRDTAPTAPAWRRLLNLTQ
jgi:hypothetical protein